ncbi:hypothetical protein ACGFNP_27180 [Nonomuraea sp. NPDC049269]
MCIDSRSPALPSPRPLSRQTTFPEYRSETAVIHRRALSGHCTDGLDRHIADMKALFVRAPDTRILEHPIRGAMNEFTAVIGVMRGTFTRPMPDGKGGHIPPTGRSYAINMATEKAYPVIGERAAEMVGAG